jgi:hypothetical protein
MHRIYYDNKISNFLIIKMYKMLLLVINELLFVKKLLLLIHILQILYILI